MLVLLIFLGIHYGVFCLVLFLSWQTFTSYLDIHQRAPDKTER